MKKKSKFTWSDAIITVLIKNNLIASLKTLHQEAPVIYSQHNIITGKTPFKTINERVQRDKRFVKLSPGLYSLSDKINDLPKEYNPMLQTNDEKEILNHISVQALLLQLGEIYKFYTFTPDKSKKVLNKTLSEYITLSEYPNFTYKRIIDRVKFIDVSWFNERKFPSNLFEVENSSDMKNALSKFMELIDFKTKMTIVAPQKRENEFRKIMEQPTFKSISNQTLFWSFEKVEKLYNAEKEIHYLRKQIT